jgi:hypothetical protein
VSAGDPFVRYPNEGTVQMIVLGADTHKVSHTVAAVAELTGRAVAERTVPARRRSFDDLLQWARALDAERVWAIEDCRHVSGALEHFLLARGERLLRVAPGLMAGARRSARERGKSDRSTPSRSRAPRSASGLTRSQAHSWPAANSTCARWSTIASGWSRSAPR